MTAWAHDVYYCLRRLGRAPGFALTTVALLAVAFAANAGVFSLVYCLLYKPLPVPGSDRLVNIRIHVIRENADSLVPAEAVRYVTDQRQIFDQAAGAVRGNSELQNGPGVEATDLSTLLVDPHLFALLGLRPIAGRLLNDADLRTLNRGTLLVSAAFAVHRYGSVAAAIDQPLELNRGHYRIVGVLPADVPYGSYAKLWIPASFSEDVIRAQPEFGRQWAACVGRLASGVTAADAGRGLTAILAALPGNKDNGLVDKIQVRAEPLRTLWIGDTENNVVLAMMLSTALLLMLITGINACNLYIARLASRQHENALLAALGAGPWRLARIVLTEAAIISVVASGLSLELVPASLRVLASFDLIPEETPYPVGLDSATLAFVALLAVTVAAALGSSAWWLQHRAGAAYEVLKQAGSRQTSGVRVRDARNALTVAQVALTVALLFGCGLLMHSAHQLLTEDLGFNRERLLLTGLNLQTDPASYATAVRRLRDRVATTPGVVGATLASTVAFGDYSWERSFQPPGADIPEIGRWPTASFYDNIEPDFFAVLGQPIVAGRPFTADEARTQAPVTIVDTKFVKTQFPDGVALGRRFRISLPSSDSTNLEDRGTAREMTIVGVVGPVKSWLSFTGVDDKPAIYVPGLEGAQLVIRTAMDPTSIEPALRSIVHDISPKARLGVTSVLTDRLTSLSKLRFRLNGLLALLGVVTLVLAGVGLYAVLSYSVRMRMPEFGVRLALGAEASQLRRDVLLQGLKLAAVGALVGLPLAFGLSNVLESQLYRVGRLDPVTLLAVLGVIAVVSVVASWWPARAAARVDPMTALRAE